MWSATSKTLYETPSSRIGKHDWKAVVYREYTGEVYLSYLWWEDWRWRDMHDWPRYNFNDGCYAGCPKTLVNLYRQYEHEIKTALATARAA